MEITKEELDADAAISATSGAAADAAGAARAAQKEQFIKVIATKDETIGETK